MAQSTVDEIVREYHEQFETAPPTYAARGRASPGGVAGDTLRREDISLLVRNFHTNLSSRGSYRNSASFSDEFNVNDLNTITTASEASRAGGGAVLAPPLRGTRSSTTTEESSESHLNDVTTGDQQRNDVIESYVDFSQFHERWNAPQNNELRQRVANILNRNPHENGDIR